MILILPTMPKVCDNPMYEEAHDISIRVDDGTLADCGVAVLYPEIGPVAREAAGSPEPVGGDPVASRTCSVCKQQKPIGEFYKEPRNKSGILAACKACICSRVKRFQDSNKDAIKTRKKKHREKNIEAIRAKDRARNLANREARNLEKKAWREKNRERYRAYCRARYAKNPQAFHAAVKKWTARNIDAARAHWRMRDARKRSAAGTHTASDILEIRAQQHDRCAVCRVNLKKKGHVDHIVALSKGGGNGRKNLQLLCAPCNHSKCARDMIEFMQSRGNLI